MLRRNMISRALHESAKKTAPSDETYQNILSGILPGAEIASGRASYTNAAGRVGMLAKSALLNTIGIFTSTGVALAAVTAFLLVSPIITDIYVDNQTPIVQMANIVVVVSEAIPVQSVTVISEQGVPLAASLDESGAYTAPVMQNGSYMVEVKGSNGKTAAASVEVDCVDSVIPEMLDYTLDDDYVYIRFYDASAGVDWSLIYGLDQAGKHIAPAEVRPDEGLAIFALPKSDIDIYVQDLAGNAAKCTVSVFYD